MFVAHMQHCAAEPYVAAKERAPMQLLLVEDDTKLAASLAHILQENGHDLDVVHDGRTGFEYARTQAYDVIILDVMLPEMDGYEVIAALRREHVATPVLMLTARSATSDKIMGFDSGADDYMTKPFSPAELLAHLRALSRRQGEVIFETLTCGDLSLNLESMVLTCANESINLRMKEFLILKILMSNPGHIVSKDTLITKVWGAQGATESNNVEAHVSFLRKKLKFLNSSVRIETIPKLGYKLVASEEAHEG